jgi:hypothetical protein
MGPLFNNHQRCLQPPTALASHSCIRSFNASNILRQSELSNFLDRQPSSPPDSTPSSSSDATNSTPSSTPPPPLQQNRRSFPVRHSRAQAPRMCRNPTELQKLTAHLLEAPKGSLFAFQPHETTSAQAWQKADAAIQQVEYVLRGHSATLPTSIHYRSTDDTVVEWDESMNVTVQTMQQLLDRIWEEGELYMTMRSKHLQETTGYVPPSDIDPFLVGSNQEDDDTLTLEDGTNKYVTDVGNVDEYEIEKHATDEEVAVKYETDKETVGLQEEDEEEAVKYQTEKNGSNQEESDVQETDEEGTDEYETDENEADEEETVEYETDEEDNEDSTEPEPFMNDFAFPGPTVAMYGLVLDAFACQAHAAHINSNIDDDTKTHVPVAHPGDVHNMLELLMQRHLLDGGDTENANVHTRITVLPLNAALRYASSLPQIKTPTEDSINAYRDPSMVLALGIFDYLVHSKALERNSATYEYLLKNLARSLPTSRSKGNIMFGVFHQATIHGLVSRSVVQAYKEGNIPSNGPEFDQWMQHSLEGKEWNELPHYWRRWYKVKQSSPREPHY